MMGMIEEEGLDPIPDEDECIDSMMEQVDDPRFHSWLNKESPTSVRKDGARLASLNSDYASPGNSRRGTLAESEEVLFEDVPLELAPQPDLKRPMMAYEEGPGQGADPTFENKTLSSDSPFLVPRSSPPSSPSSTSETTGQSEFSTEDSEECGSRGDVLCQACGELVRSTPMMKRKHKAECSAGNRLLSDRFLSPQDAEVVANAGNRSFEMIETIGVGNFGIVKLCALEGVDRPFSIKILSKQQLLQMSRGREVHLAERVRSERKVLHDVQHPFIVNLYRTFQTKSYLYMLMDFVPGGEIFYHLRRAGRFPEGMAQFYAAQIVLVLEYLHSRGIAYRDLKTENLLISVNGYLRVIDFGFAKYFTKGSRSFTICGTPEYLAPEIITSRGHSFPVDWWALGILVYEMIVGMTPFYDEESETKVYSNVLSGRVPERSPLVPGSAATDLINELLVSDPAARLGCTSAIEGAEDVKRHPFFSSVDWESLYMERLSAPLIPELQSVWDCSFFEKYPEEECTLPPPGLLTSEQQAIFEDF